MNQVVIYALVSLTNVILHIVKNILVIKSGKTVASIANCICYTFAAVVIKFIAEVNLTTAIIVQASTNFLGCYIGMFICEKVLKNREKQEL